jgi:hypothetical protein
MKSRSNVKKTIRAGEVLLAAQIDSNRGMLRVEDPDDARLVAIFLGTVAKGEDPHPVERLNKLGWTRSTVYEVTAQYGDGEQRWVHRLNFTAATPKEAGLAAVRFARQMRTHEFVASEGRPISILALNVCTMRLGEIDAEGKPVNGRGPSFVRWADGKEETLDDFVFKMESL